MSFTAVDLSQVPAPDVVETLSFETILAAMLADLRARDPAFTATVESDPAYKVLEVAAYRELIIRQRVNDASRAVMLAYATGADLENLAAFFSVTRLVTDPGDPDASPPVPPTFETDADLRRRVTLAVEGFSTAGPVGAYTFHALSAHPDVLDVGVDSPSPGDVRVVVLSRSGTGVPATPVLAAVNTALNAETVRPLCDSVSVQAVSLVNFNVAATLFFDPGPDQAVIIAEAQAAVNAYLAAQRKIGRNVNRSGLIAALHRPGVTRASLTAPAADVVVSATQVGNCTGVVLTNGGVNE